MQDTISETEDRKKSNTHLLMVPIKSTISVKNIVGSHICVSVDDGHKVYNYINKLLKTQNAHAIEQIRNGVFDHSKDMVLEIDVDFEGATALTAAFVNAAIGQLYDKPTLKFTVKHIKYIGLEDSDKTLIERVIANAKRYYDNPKHWIKTMNKIIDEWE